jgi:hypothetical protein
MTAMHVAYTSSPKLRCFFYTIVIRNQSLQEKYPGGRKAFINRYKAPSNDRITVYCDMGSDIGDIFRDLEERGMEDFEDFTTLDAAESDMWCCCKPEMRKQPFPVDTQVGWLKGEYRDGTVWVWFCG